MKIAVIIPALDEGERIAETVRHVMGAEVIVADGGSSDDTRARAKEAGAAVLSVAGGRAAQQNAAAAAAEAADAFVFLHADTQLPSGWAGAVRRTLADPAVALGAFSLGIESPSRSLRLVAAGANLRSRLLRRPYGDQALFLRRETFERLGGFRQLAIMEDLDLVERAGQLGTVVTVPQRVQTSARRWEQVGLLRTTISNQGMLIGRFLGISEDRLATVYRRAAQRRRRSGSLRKRQA